VNFGIRTCFCVRVVCVLVRERKVKGDKKRKR
jgi:hypothetical protein